MPPMSDSAASAAVTETHISTLFFTDDRAYKILKPIKTSFLDFSTSKDRLEAVAEELELNRRIAPDVYLGTAEVTELGETVDAMLVMRRLPTDRRLTVLIGTDGFEDHLRGVAREIATFHAAQTSLHGVPEIAGRDAVAQNWANNFNDLDEVVGTLIHEADAARAKHLVNQYVSGREPLFAARMAEGFICDGHGDLTAEDIFCLDDGPRILDCLAFDRKLRVSDVLADIAFLAMDLDRLAGPAVSRQFVQWYCEFTNEHHPASLAHLYVAYRAHVRAKVAAVRLKQGHSEQANLVRSYHDLCLRHLERAQLQLILVGGTAGTGKSTLASSLSDSLGAMLITSDELRKDLTGHGHLDRGTSALGEGIYRPEVSEKLYDEMLRRAGCLLEKGESVVIDASWNADERRAAARILGKSKGAAVHELQCTVDNDVAKARVEARLAADTDASDARPDLLDALRKEFEPWPTCEPIDTADDVDSVLARSLNILQRHRQ